MTVTRPLPPDRNRRTCAGNRRSTDLGDGAGRRTSALLYTIGNSRPVAVIRFIDKQMFDIYSRTAQGPKAYRLTGSCGRSVGVMACAGAQGSYGALRRGSALCRHVRLKEPPLSWKSFEGVSTAIRESDARPRCQLFDGVRHENLTRLSDCLDSAARV